MSSICTGEESLFTSSSSGRLFRCTETQGRGGEQGCKMDDFYSPYLFKQSSLKNFFPLSLNTFHCEILQLEGFESSYSAAWSKAAELWGNV